MRTVRAATVALASVVAACSAGGAPSERAESPLTVAFGQAATSSGVPRDLLVAIARVEDGLSIPAQRQGLEEDSAVPAAGPLMLRRGKLDTLARGAALSGKSELELRRDADLALGAGALVLAELGAKTGARAGDLGSWKSAIEEMSGYGDDAHREEYAHRVFAALARGGRFEARDGEIVGLDPHDLPPTLTLDLSTELHTLARAQFPGAEWIPTSCRNKCNPDRDGASVEYIVVHDTEGGWDASVSTLQNDPNKSVQYIVGTDGRVAQFVTEETTAWHAGNSYYNARSIGIEHVGYSKKPFTEAEYAASAKLVDYLGQKYGVPLDRAHIIGHDQIPNGTKISSSSAPCSGSPKACQGNASYGGANHHTDPGVWEWPTFMARFGGASKCNDVTSIWNCSYDKKQAFRCAGGKVSIEICDGAGACESKPVGQDDVCHAAKPSSAPPAVPGTAERPPVSETTGAPLTVPEDESADASDSGCSVSSRGSPGSSGSAMAALALVIVASRRRRMVRETPASSAK